MQQEPSLDVLSVYPCTRGYAFVHFQSRARVADWGRRQINTSRVRRNAATLASVQELIDASPPDLLLIEDHAERGSRRSARIRRLHRSLAHLAQARGIDVERIARTEIKTAFSSVGAATRYEIAQAVAQEFQEFGYRLPRKRRAWDREPEIMALFMAAALGTTYYARSAT